VAVDRLDALPDALGHVRERLEVDAFLLRSELLVHVGVREREHSAVGMSDHDRFLGSQEVVGDEQGANRLVVDEPAGVPDTCASPSSSPRKPAGSRRASMQVTTASLLPGGVESSPLANPDA
jgi:hypothetical protein